MQPIKQFLEWYLGIPPAQPGQGTTWSIQHDAPWPAWIPVWALWLIAIAAAAWVAWIYSRDATGIPLHRRVLLIALRLVLVSLALAFFSGLRLSVVQSGLPVVAVMIDDSASMALEDTYPREDDATVARHLASQVESPASTRWNLARSILLSNDAEFLRQALKQHMLRIYRFSETAVPVGTGEFVGVEAIPELASQLNDIKPEGNRTRPGPAIRKVLDDLRGSPPSAIVLLSDGITSTTDADRLTQGAEQARANLVPIYTIGIGSEEPTRDVEMYDLLVDDIAFINDPLIFTATIKAHGLAGKAVTATLKLQGSNEILTSKPMQLASDGEAVSLELTYAPSKPGEYDYVVDISIAPGETNIENNSAMRHVSVREEKIRVLLVDLAPRWEFRFVKHLLEREPTVKIRTVLFEADNEYASEDETALANFPVSREELFQYDVVILGDVNPAFLSTTSLDNLQAFVSSLGGGLIVVAGPQNAPASFRGTPLETLLPVELEQAPNTEPPFPSMEGFRPRLTADGKNGTPIFRFPETLAETVDVWDKLPPLFWLSESLMLKPGARVFAEYRPPGAAIAALPVISMAPFGSGKVLFHATDELWRWRFRSGDRYYARYWIQALRYLSRSKILGRDRNAELTVDRLVYEQGEPVGLRVRFFNERLAPQETNDVKVAIERRGDARQSLTLTRRTDAPNIYETQWRGSSPGSFHAWVITPSSAESPPSADFRIEPPRGELERRSLDRRELEQTALITHGLFYRLAEASRAPHDLPAGSPMLLKAQDPISLWNRPELLGLFAMILTAEWLLRKRSRLI